MLPLFNHQIKSFGLFRRRKGRLAPDPADECGGLQVPDDNAEVFRSGDEPAVVGRDVQASDRSTVTFERGHVSVARCGCRPPNQRLCTSPDDRDDRLGVRTGCHQLDPIRTLDTCWHKILENSVQQLKLFKVEQLKLSILRPNLTTAQKSGQSDQGIETIG